MNKIWITGLLLLASLSPGMAQLVDPDDGPGEVTTQVAEIDGTKKSSLKEAFGAATADGKTIKLLISTQLKEQLGVNYTTTLNLQQLLLDCPSGTGFNLADGKTLVVQKGTLKGTLSLAGNGNLFAGTDVVMRELTVNSGTQTLYRIPVELPAADGTVTNVRFQNKAVAHYARQGDVLCCWLPKGVTSGVVGFDFTPASGGIVSYETGSLTPTGHAESLISSAPLPDGSVAAIEATRYATAAEALKVAAANGATVNLLKSASLGEDITISVSQKPTLQLNGFTLEDISKTLDASTTGACLFISDNAGTGRLSGTLRIRGNIYVDKSIPAGNIGVVQSASSPYTQLYRVLVNTTLADGEAKFTFGSTVAAPTACYVKDGVACLWLPAGATGDLKLEGAAGTEFEAKDVTISAGHSNTVTVTKPGVVAAIGNTEYTSLKAAFAAAATGQTIRLLGNLTLSESLTTTANAAITLDLDAHTLNGATSGAFKPATDGTLLIRNGQMTGNIEVTGSVVADRTVLLTAAVTESNRQVYRVRLLLLSADKSKTPLTFTYGTETGQLPLLLDETVNSNQVTATYCWLPVHAAATFSLSLNGNEQRNRGDILIQSNHDNEIDLTKGDIEVVLYKGNNGTSTEVETFHQALEEAKGASGSRLYLQRDVQFAGSTPHTHTLANSVINTLYMEGHNLTATNCTLDASATNSCFIISDASGRGRITGTFIINGNVYIKEMASGNIGKVQLADGTQLFRALVRINTLNTVADGFGTYQLTGMAAATPCYIQDKTACLWLPVNAVPQELTIDVSGTVYKASGIQVIEAHSNAVTVSEPSVVAKIGTTTYTTLSDAIANVTTGETIELMQNTTLDTEADFGNKDVTLDLNEFTLTFQSTGVCKVGDSNQLLVRSSNSRGVLAGNPSFTGDVCVSASVSIPGQVTLTPKSTGQPATVYRTRLYMPAGSTGGTYTYDSQTGSLRMIGEQNGGRPVGYLWLSTVANATDLVVALAPGNTSIPLANIIIQANHNNLIDLEAGDNVAEVEGVKYPTLQTAFEALNKTAGGGTLTLLRNQSLHGIQSISKTSVIDLNNHILTLADDAGFDVGNNVTLRITDQASGTADKGYLYGFLRMNRNIYIDPEISLNGTVIMNGTEVHRLLVEGLPDVQALTGLDYTHSASGTTKTALRFGTTACIWQPEVEFEEDLQFTISSTDYETTLTSSLSGHNTVQKVYKRVEVDGNKTWRDGTYKDYNVVVKSGTLTIDAGGKLANLNRLTICNAAQVDCKDRVLATAGIVYRLSFVNPNQWQSFSLPFEARSITAVFNGKTVAVNPYLADGSGGHFWLKTLAADGSFDYITKDRIESNVGYIIAVPSDLATNGNTTNPDVAIRFTSAPNQFLKRTAQPVQTPSSGFLQLCSGLLSEMAMAQPFYLLNADGTEFVRQPADESVPPFSGYLLAERQIVTNFATLRMTGLPTGNETIRPQLPNPGLRVYTAVGGIRVETDREQPLSVYSIGGRLYLNRQIPEGNTYLSLPAGVYIVNREKIIVNK